PWPGPGPPGRGRGGGGGGRPGPPLEACAVALATLPGIGPVRLAAVLRDRSPVEAWATVQAGAPGPMGPVWRTRARAYDVEAGWAAVRAEGVAAHVLGLTGYPPELAGDHEAPGVLFSRG